MTTWGLDLKQNIRYVKHNAAQASENYTQLVKWESELFQTELELLIVSWQQNNSSEKEKSEVQFTQSFQRTFMLNIRTY